MSGILNKKQRVMDFSLTRNGYEQTQNNDLRIKYATFTDKDAIYDIKEKTYNVSDNDCMPFMFEAFHTDHDIINHEIDLKTKMIDYGYTPGIQSLTNDISIQNGYIATNISGSQLDQLFDDLTLMSQNAINNQGIILTDNFVSFDNQSGANLDIDLKLSKINDIENKSYSLKNVSLNLQRSFKDNEYATLNDVLIDIDNIDLIKDSRFLNKLPYQFLPPSNMNVNVVSKNEKIKKFFNISQDTRSRKQIVYKNLKRNMSSLNRIKGFISINENDDIEKIIDDSIANLELLSMSKITIDNIEKENVGKILSAELLFSKIENNSPFMFQLYESVPQENDSKSKFNKLFVVDHGEFYSKNKQKNIQVFLVGKLYHSKQDIYHEENNYISNDDYTFVNLFTIVIE